MKGNLLRTSQAAVGVALLAIGLALPAHAAGEHGGGHGGHAMPAAAASIGKPGDPARATRTVDVDMADSMRFTPNASRSRPGKPCV